VACGAFLNLRPKTEANAWLQSYFSLELSGQNRLKQEEQEPLIHVFSHFRLMIQPVIIHLDEQENPINPPMKQRVMETDESLWYNIDTEFNGGLASPVQALLNKLKD